MNTHTNKENHRPLDRAELKQEYETYLRRQRGLSERTIFHSWRIADRFLEFRFGGEAGDLSRITSADIVGFLQLVTTRTPPLRDKTLSSHLRNFFRYLFKAGKTTANLALDIPSVAQRYGTRLPRHLTTEQVDILVRAVRTDATCTLICASRKRLSRVSPLLHPSPDDTDRTIHCSLSSNPSDYAEQPRRNAPDYGTLNVRRGIIWKSALCVISCANVA